MDNSDGNISDVNPELLKLCANADEWREQRRRAMKAKIFGSGSGGGSDNSGGGENNVSAYAPSQGTAGSMSSATAQLPASQQAAEAYILQQLLSLK